MGDECLSWRERFNHLEGFGQTEVGKVFLFPQSVNHQYLHTFQLIQFFRLDTVGIGHIPQPSDPVTQHGHVLVHRLDRHHLHAAHAERWLVARKLVNHRLGQTGKLVRRKDIMVVALNGRAGNPVAIEVHLLILHIVERPDVVQPGHVVPVGMGDKDALQMHHLLPQHLVPEVGANVNQDILPRVGHHKSRRAQMLVMPVIRLAYSTPTGNNGHSHRSTRSQKNQSHLFVLYRQPESHAVHIHNLHSGVNLQVLA